jgi:hypothetical protein
MRGERPAGVVPAVIAGATPNNIQTLLKEVPILNYKLSQSLRGDLHGDMAQPLRSAMGGVEGVSRSAAFEPLSCGEIPPGPPARCSPGASTHLR